LQNVQFLEFYSGFSSDGFIPRTVDIPVANYFSKLREMFWRERCNVRYHHLHRI